jgi:hypothetical protein
MAVFQWLRVGCCLFTRRIASAPGAESEQKARQRKMADLSKFVLTFVLNRPGFKAIFSTFTAEKRRGRESNPRIAVLQTATLPLGYPADGEKMQTIPI